MLSHHGNIEKALSLCGPVLCGHQTINFVPIDLFIPCAYPAVPPICYVRPGKGKFKKKTQKKIKISKKICFQDKHW